MWAVHVVRKGLKTNVYRLLVGKPEGKRPLGRPSRRCVGNIKIDFVKIVKIVTMLGGSSCHHGMARPRVADGRDGLQLEVSCEYIE
jgi:hypothetical protein